MKSLTSTHVGLQGCNPLPPYLSNIEPLEAEDIPLQLALLTMEMAEHRRMLERLATLLETAARLIKPAGLRVDDL